jgi:hypothetical protein
MSEGPSRRSLFAVCILGVLTIVCLLLGNRWLSNYADEQRAKHPKPVEDSSGVTGEVVFADGSPAPFARISVAWRDSAGAPGTTPALADADGRFAARNVPPRAAVDEIRASIGPLAAKLGATSGRARIQLPGAFRLAGLVRRVGDRGSISGATLRCAALETTSGRDGDFKLESVPAAALRGERPVVRVEAAGFKPLDWPLPTDYLPETYGDLTILMEAIK